MFFFLLLRYDTNKHKVWDKEACEKTTAVCLCSWCPDNQNEVQRAKYCQAHFSVCCILQVLNSLVVKSIRKPHRQTNLTALPDHWDKTQIPQTGYKVSRTVSSLNVIHRFYKCDLKSGLFTGDTDWWCSGENLNSVVKSHESHVCAVHRPLAFLSGHRGILEHLREWFIFLLFLQLVPLERSSPEFQEVRDLFYETMRGFEIVNIERIQNKCLWEVFQL